MENIASVEESRKLLLKWLPNNSIGHEEESIKNFLIRYFPMNVQFALTEKAIAGCPMKIFGNRNSFNDVIIVEVRPSRSGAVLRRFGLGVCYSLTAQSMELYICNCLKGRNNPD